MAGSTSTLFYNRLPVNMLPLSELLMEPHLFFEVPSDWHVVITDVKNSTQAAAAGNHQQVNMVATGSIVAVLNIALQDQVYIPFFFGGDGGTFLLPPALLEPTLQALYKHRENTAREFGLELRVGQVPVTTIYNEGHALRITKLQASRIFNIPVVLGDGLMVAEKKIKADALAYPATSADTELDMSGMHCRWDKIKPPASTQEVVSLVVIAGENGGQAEAFRNVVLAIDRIYGPQEQRKPVTVDRLRMLSSLKRIRAEMKTAKGGFNLWYMVRTWFTTLVGQLYFRTKKGKEYLYKLVEMTDTLVVDGKINTVITGTAEQRIALQQELQQLEQQGKILFGLHRSTESVMSCYVRNLDDEHVHFVDGADGGYTKAAGLLKKKIAELHTP